MMKTIVCMQPGQLEMRTAKIPELKSGQVLIKIKRIGVCGTDIHAFSGNQPFFEYPRILGHELAGIVESVGHGVSIEPGSTAYIIPYLECGTCIACRHGKPNCCANMQVLGVHINGGMCEYITVPEDHVVVAENLTLDQLALVECLAIGAHAVRLANIKAGATLLTVGAGPIGMGIMQFAKVQGARVIALDMNPTRLQFCKTSLGVDETINAFEDVESRLTLLTDGDYPQVVVDATGNPKAMMAGFQWVAHGGTYVFVSVVDADISFSDPEFHKRELKLLGSRNATREDFKHVVSCLQKGIVTASPMITHRGHFTQLIDLFPVWSAPNSGVIKAVVEL